MPEFSSYGGGPGGSPSYTGVTAINHVSNPSLETGITGYSTAGTVPTVFGQGIVLAVDGTSTLRLNATLANSGNLTEVEIPVSYPSPLTPSVSYTFQQRYNGVTANGGALQMFIDWFDSVGAAISTSSGATTIRSGANLATLTAVSPSNAASANLRTRWCGFGGGATTIDVYIDAICFSTSASYFDGNTSGAHWFGTSGLSASYMVQGAEKFMVAYDALKFDKQKPVILFSHGYSGDGWSERIDGFGGEITHALCDYGYLVMGIDAGGPSTFGNSVAMTSTEAARVFARSQFGVIPTKANLLGFSMGGLVSLNYAYFHTATTNAVAGICPATELGSFHANPAFTAAIDVAYAGDYVANGSNIGYSPLGNMNTGAFPIHIPVGIWHNQDDTTVTPAIIKSFRDSAIFDSLVPPLNGTRGPITFRNNGNTGFGHSPFPTDPNEIVGFFARYDPPWQ